MTDKITSFDNRPVPLNTDRKVGRSEDAPSNASGASSSASADPVRITDQARTLAALEQTIQGLPEINEAKVAEFRRAIEEGRYEVNPERIADKLIRSERELGM